MNVLVYSDISLADDYRAGNINAFMALLDWLSSRYRVTLLYTHFRRPTRPLPAGVDLHWKPAFANLVERKVRSRLGRTRRLLDYKRAGSRQRAFDQLLRSRQIDVVIIEYLDNSFLLESKALGEKTVTICDLHDLMSERSAAFARHGVVTGENLLITGQEEMGAIARFDRAIVLQAPEGARIDAALGRRASIVTRRTDAKPPAALAPSRMLDDHIHVGFIGTTTEFNLDAARELATTWRVEDGRIRYFFAGPVCERMELGSLPPGTTLRGRIDDVASFYAGIDVLANPVRFGSGLKTKHVEAIAHGVPVVTTQLGAEGLEDVVDEAVFVATTADDFSAALQRIRHMAAQGGMRERMRGVWQTHFAPDAAFGALKDYLDAVAKA